ncbi:MAG: glycosyltransferase family 4 protein [Geobacteraceae bacterium]
MKILLITKNAESLTGAGTYEANLIRELSKRHQVGVYRSPADLEQKWDIAHCTDLKHLTFKVAKALRCPLVVDAHDYYWVHFYRFFCLDSPLRYLIQKYRRTKYHFLFKRIDGIILHGKFLYDLYDHPNKYLSFYFGLDYSGIETKPWKDRENLILFVGGDFFRKGLPRLLRALPGVLANVPDTRLLVIGKDYWYAKILARFMSRKLPVDFRYGMPREEVYRTYSRSRVMVLPSEIEATPIVVAEATMAGVPPILSAVGGHPELVRDGETGFLFPLEDTSMLTEKIIACLTDRKLSEKLVAEGKAFLGQLTIERMMERLEEIYHDVITAKCQADRAREHL